MAHVREVLDRLADGKMTLGEAVNDFRDRKWPKQPATTDAQAWGVEDDTPAPVDSWEQVNTDSRLTTDQYAQLAAAYTAATGRKITATRRHHPDQLALPLYE